MIILIHFVGHHPLAHADHDFSKQADDEDKEQTSAVMGFCQCDNAPFSCPTPLTVGSPNQSRQADVSKTRAEPQSELRTQCSLLLHTAGLHTLTCSHEQLPIGRRWRLGGDRGPGGKTE